MDPQGPAQPDINTSYKTSGNPTDKEPLERSTAAQKDIDSSAPVSTRRDQDIPSTHNASARPSALNAGEDGPLTERQLEPDSSSGRTAQGQDPNLEGEQMRAPGEGDVAAAVMTEHTHGKSEPGFTEDLDKKKEEHMRKLEEKGESLEQREREDWTQLRGGVDVGEALAGRGTGVVLTGDTSNLSGGAREGLGDA